MISRRPGRPGLAGGKTIDDFLNDLPPGEVGGKIADDLLMISRRGWWGRGGRWKKIQNFPKSEISKN